MLLYIFAENLLQLHCCLRTEDKGIYFIIEFQRAGIQIGCSNCAELTVNHPDQYVHYFVSMEIVLSERPFFLERLHKTIVLTTSQNGTIQLADFHCLYINQPEQQLLHDLLQLEQHGHRGGRNMPSADSQSQQVLTRREIEVMALIVEGYINKEVADKLHIGLSTVVTHRKNIMEKLGLKSVSTLTIYAVTHGYVDIDKLKG